MDINDNLSSNQELTMKLYEHSLNSFFTECLKPVKEIKAEDLTLRDLTIYECLQSSGMRRSELVGLNIQDVNLETRCAHVTGKGNIERVVQLSSEACYYIEKLINTHPGGKHYF